MYVDEIALVPYRERELTDIVNADTADRVIDSNELASRMDLDNDGYTNSAEIRAGSDPFDSQSIPLPIADMQGDYRGVIGHPVRFIGSMSYDPDWREGGKITNYLWQILDEGENKWRVIGQDSAGKQIIDNVHIFIVDTQSPGVESYSVE